MRVKTISSPSSEELYGFDSMRWDIAFHGAGIDDRSKTAVRVITSKASQSVEAQFCAEQPDRLLLNGDQWAQRRALVDQMRGKRCVVFETTSLGTVEILFLLRAAKAADLQSVDCIYVEPRDYAKDIYLDSFWSREFSLSENRRLEGVRGFAYKLSELSNQDARLVVFLGYEASRLAAACEQEDALVGWKKYAIFGVPSYAPGWEMNAIANNIDALERHKFDSIRYCSASSVSGAFDLLNLIHADGRRENAHTVIAPFGTKPHAIATAMFLVENSNYQASSLLYDHPERSEGRSSEVRRWHLYHIDLSSAHGD